MAELPTQRAGRLTKREIAAFKRDGYCIRRGILSPELCAAARDRYVAVPPVSSHAYAYQVHRC